MWTQSTLQQSKARENVKEHQSAVLEEAHESAVLQEAHKSTWQESKVKEHGKEHVKAHQNAVLQEEHHRASAARTSRLAQTPKKQDAKTP